MTKYDFMFFSAEEPCLPRCAVLFIFLYRLLLCVTVKTAESPDEWWQSSEVAYYMVYGKGHLPWEWYAGVRSVIFPGMLAVPFFLLKQLGLDSTWAVWFVSRLLQTFVITGIDIYTFWLGASLDAKLQDTVVNKKIRKSITGLFVVVSLKDMKAIEGRWNSVAYFALILSLTNWYMAFVGVRLYSNVIEVLLVLMALQQKSYVRFLFLSGLACTVRATSGVALFPLVFLHLGRAVQERGTCRGLVYIAFWSIFMLLTMLGGMVVADSLFYKRWIVTPYVFLEFNVLQNASRFFGEHPWYFYLFPCLPALLGPHVLFILSAPLVLWRDKASRVVMWRVCGLLLFTVPPLVCYSLIGHKENRFIITLFPMYFVVAAFVLSRWHNRSFCVRWIHAMFLALNILVALLAGYVYRRGPLDVMEEVRSGPKINTLDVIARCYTTAGYSYMHGKVDHLRLVDCSMRLDKKTGLPEMTEDAVFQRYPKDFVLWRYDGMHTLDVRDPEEQRGAADLERTVAPKMAPHPDVIVMYRNLAEKLKDSFLNKHGYKLYRSFFHSPLVIESFEDFYIEMWVRKVT